MFQPTPSQTPYCPRWTGLCRARCPHPARSTLPEAAAASPGLAPHPRAHSARAAPGPAESRGAAGRRGEQARAPRSTPGSRCSPSGPAPDGPGAGTRTTREPARPQPQRPLGPGRLRRGEGGRRPRPAPSESASASAVALPGSGSAGPCEGRRQGRRRQTVGRGPEGAGTRDGRQRSPWDRLSEEREKESD